MSSRRTETLPSVQSTFSTPAISPICQPHINSGHEHCNDSTVLEDTRVEHSSTPVQSAGHVSCSSLPLSSHLSGSKFQSRTALRIFPARASPETPVSQSTKPRNSSFTSELSTYRKNQWHLLEICRVSGFISHHSEERRRSGLLQDLFADIFTTASNELIL